MKSKKNKKYIFSKGLVRGIHLKALLFLGIYLVISKAISLHSIINPSLVESFLFPYLYGTSAGIIFLYLYSHEDFFHFIKEVEYIEDRKEKQYLHKYLHFGKIASIIIIGTVGGPLFSSFTARLLIPGRNYGYILIAAANLPSTLIHLGIFKGFFNYFI